ncbi:flagellar protein FlgJ [Caminicella sporogenes DSM 14501]|uniref:Flagellar protein FlgJ n=1 Tax=Caminicella sporogenes DSM 14501 TaxID=1121266 RepID=A0A1M6PV38_9FIRM|nr:rod-binding protein [Caminicella sporogenes]RKD21959.1 hypothetical protein BET04_06830 [Caminicella sporogenes]SHK11809.1 flagellar protein FlgJ [Caminicella sporogenes DSM 14501]
MKINDINLQSKIYQSKIKASKQNTQQFKEMLEKAKQNNDTEALKSACKQFEAIFVNMLLKNMRKTVVEGGFIKKSHAREIFEGMLDEEIAKEVSKGQGIGLAKIMYEQLSKNINFDKE